MVRVHPCRNITKPTVISESCANKHVKRVFLDGTKGFHSFHLRSTAKVFLTFSIFIILQLYVSFSHFLSAFYLSFSLSPSQSLHSLSIFSNVTFFRLHSISISVSLLCVYDAQYFISFCFFLFVVFLLSYTNNVDGIIHFFCAVLIFLLIVIVI